ncbi:MULTISPECIES: carboxypeptidase-like regulatory domain-containing protein [unclassified Psychrobacter]|uniref:carboxypeptidase-like regulatory domain-containing protein n=1 Tax=unclassified Psychrobacter TaxID=196806 RepID=UPI0025B60E4F|nr:MULTISPECIES: carboxypeptidase-like regulatory domain-containing protein [unclassified Psychrobacter]MDN3453072.1 carboxypeptidase-like regulatory domain-containing protein [Psychrobacter sp. APC 3350]MDN3502896.1 carboxypeptidase-like regulatory domain-containing protein [Psychrobacter sp. 5A.1]
MIKITLLTASMLVITLSLTACGDDNKNNDTVAQPENTDVVKQQSIYGIVTDNSGNPLVDATIKIGKYIVMTDNAGKYALSIDDVVSNPVILVKKSGYLTAARTLNLIPKHKHSFDISLSADQVTTAFTTGAGINELQVSGATVSIPANTIVNADGSDYTGTVNIAANYYHPDSIAGARAFAQPFAGQDADGSNPTNLITVGVIDVKLTNPTTGAKLDLKEGSTATLTYPEVTTDQDLASIPLWYYDEEKTIWVKEGAAIRQTDGSYKGQVPHFTLWNLDITLDEYYAILEGCVIDAKTKKPYTKDDFSGQVTGRGSFFSAGGADSEGKFSIKVPFNTPLTLSSYLYSVKFNTIRIPALAQNGTYQINNGNCIEIETIDSDGEIDLNNSDVGGTFDELPLAPVPVTPTPVIPDMPFQPPTEQNTTGLIGYIFNFETDSDNASGLENISFSTLSTKSSNSLNSIEKSLYVTQDYEGVEAKSLLLLTTMGISPAFKYSVTTDNALNIEQFNTVFSNNRYTQSLSNGYVSTGTYTDVSLSGQKIGNVFALENNDDDYNDIPDNVINALNNLPTSLSVFSSGASCKKTLTGSVNVDYIELIDKLPTLTFEQAIEGFTDSRRGTWAGIPWNAGVRDLTDDDAPIAYVNYNDDVYAGFYNEAALGGLKESEKNDCGLYNEVAKNQILTALRTAYPTL